MQDDRWEREALRDVALAVVQEQRRARRWGIFFKLLLIGYLTLLVVLLWPARFGEDKATASRHTAVVSVSGPIMDESGASADRIIRGLQAAFRGEHVAGVLLRIDSPGGSPVQSGRINDEIGRLRLQHPEMPVYAVVGDLCASGAYYIAVAADRIYVDKASMIGSIGVMMNSFGLTEALDKLGVERRLFTAGENKGFLDPFSPLEPEHVVHVQGMLAEIHEQFIAVVREGRGERLPADADVFNGLVWTGERSIELGLADELGSIEHVAREVIGAERLVDYTPRESLLAALADRIGASAATRLGTLLGLDLSPLR
jgi:protease IV